MLNLDYTNLIQIVQPYKVPRREEASAFLSWFLVNIYRLEAIEVQNIVCDGRGDKKLIARGRTESFTQLWNESNSQVS